MQSNLADVFAEQYTSNTENKDLMSIVVNLYMFLLSE